MRINIINNSKIFKFNNSFDFRFVVINMDVKKTLNLNQSSNIYINGDIKLKDLTADSNFQDQLQNELYLRNLEIDSNNSSPKFLPDLEPDDQVKNIDEILINVVPNISMQTFVENVKVLKVMV